MSAAIPDRVDVAVVGGGHNGLVCAAYLARAGLDVAVFEARSIVGGCAATEDACGVRVNLCNCDHTMVRSVPLIDELDLAAHGLTYLDLDPAQIARGWDAAGPFPIRHDVESTVEALALTHPEEVANYRRYAADAVPMAELVMRMAASPPSTVGMVRRAIGRQSTQAALRILQWSRRSVGDVLRSYFTSDDLLGPAMAAGPAVWGLGPETPGTGLGALAWAFKHAGTTGRPRGGSGALTDAVAAAIRGDGGRVATSTPVQTILCEGEHVRGVVVSVDGEEHLVEAGTVVVACDPREALVHRLDRPPPSAGPFLASWRDRPVVAGYESKIDARLSSLPTWRGIDVDRYAAVGVDDLLSPSTIVAPDLATIAEGRRRANRGEVLERPMLFVNVPSIHDRSMVGDVTEPDTHVLSIEVLFTPYRLAGGWDPSNEPARWLDVAAELFEPGFRDSIEEWRVVAPPDYERELGMPEGHATSFAGGPLAALLGRNPELTRYRTPIEGLVLTGAATYPGAGVWGAPGRNAAAAILDDRLGVTERRRVLTD